MILNKVFEIKYEICKNFINQTNSLLESNFNEYFANFFHQRSEVFDCDGNKLLPLNNLLLEKNFYNFDVTESLMETEKALCLSKRTVSSEPSLRDFFNGIGNDLFIIDSLGVSESEIDEMTFTYIECHCLGKDTRDFQYPFLYSRSDFQNKFGVCCSKKNLLEIIQNKKQDIDKILKQKYDVDFKNILDFCANDYSFAQQNNEKIQYASLNLFDIKEIYSQFLEDWINYKILSSFGYNLAQMYSLEEIFHSEIGEMISKEDDFIGRQFLYKSLFIAPIALMVMWSYIDLFSKEFLKDISNSYEILDNEENVSVKMGYRDNSFGQLIDNVKDMMDKYTSSVLPRYQISQKEYDEYKENTRILQDGNDDYCTLMYAIILDNFKNKKNDISLYKNANFAYKHASNICLKNNVNYFCFVKDIIKGILMSNELFKSLGTKKKGFMNAIVFVFTELSDKEDKNNLALKTSRIMNSKINNESYVETFESYWKKALKNYDVKVDKERNAITIKSLVNFL